MAGPFGGLFQSGRTGLGHFAKGCCDGYLRRNRAAGGRMDHLPVKRAWLVVMLLVALMASCSSVMAFGTVAASSTSTVTKYRGHDSLAWQDTPAAACNAVPGSLVDQVMGAPSYVHHSAPTWNDGWCRGTWTSSPPGGTTSTGQYDWGVSGGPVTVVSCPSGASDEMNDGRCFCQLGKRAEGGACVPYSCQQRAVGQSSYGPYSSYEAMRARFNGDGQRFTCDNSADNRGCTVVETYKGGAATPMGYMATVVEAYIGKPCQGQGTGMADQTENNPPEDDRPDDAAKAPTPCKATEYSGTVNGTPVCVPASKTFTNTMAKVTTNSDGTKTSTQTTASCNASACSLTTKTTTTNAAGQTTGSSETTQYTTQKEFCAEHPGDEHCGGSGSGSGEGSDFGAWCDENPTASVCKSSSWGGSCSTTFTCDGDAIQCAIAKEQHIRNCQLLETSDERSDLGIAAMNGQAQPVGHPASAASSVALTGPGGGFDQTDLIGPGACPTGPTISVLGQSMTVSFQPVCDAAGWLGNFLVGLTALACLGIVFKGN